MGWDFTRGASKKDIVNRLIAPVKRHRAGEWSNARQQWVELDYDVETKTLAHKVVSNTLWSVVETKRHRQPVEVERIIACFLLERGGIGWGYKDMCEAMHPYYYDCPLEFLDMVPVACEEWRAIVREQAVQKVRAG
jgi:hypothetical protein